jgi:CheY-like chemotaxis protein
MNGAELARAARQIAPGLPVLLVTAVAGAADRVAGDFDAVLAKPVSREALISAAESAILRAAAGRAACAC